jgi:hypothetical protein
VATAATVLLSIRAAAAGIERDFSLAGYMVSPKRSSLDPAYVEMVLTLNSLEPGEMPGLDRIGELSKEEAKAAVPARYKDVEWLKASKLLDRRLPPRRDGPLYNDISAAYADQDVEEHIMMARYEDIEFEEGVEEEELESELDLVPDDGLNIPDDMVLDEPQVWEPEQAEADEVVVMVDDNDEDAAASSMEVVS